MKKDKIIWFIIGGLILASMAAKTYLSVLKSFIPSVEGFRSYPYWDKKQWSWGYGTKVPGSTTNPNSNPGGTISRDQAYSDTVAHIQNDYNYLKPLITRSLTPNQWAALLSFSYNEGPGNADNLVSNINSGDDTALENQWNLYIYAGGEVDQDLIDRRQKEFALWEST